MIRAINEDHLDGHVLEGLGSRQAAKAPADDHDTRNSLTHTNSYLTGAGANASTCFLRSFTSSKSTSSRISVRSSTVRPSVSPVRPATIVSLLPAGHSVKLPRSFHHIATGPERCSMKC